MKRIALSICCLIVYGTGGVGTSVSLPRIGGGGDDCVSQPVTGADARLTGTLELLGSANFVALVGVPLGIGMEGARVRLPNPDCKGQTIDVPLQFSWAIKVRPPGSTAVLTNATTLFPKLVPDRPGPWTVVFTACPSTCSMADVTIPPLKRLLSFNVVSDFPNPFVIDATTRDPVGTLLFVIETHNTHADTPQVIQVCDVDLDLTARRDIEIDANLSLIASPACARGPRSLGPRLFVTDIRDEHTSLFLIRDSNVRISGFRLEGPTSWIGSLTVNKEVGIRIFPFAVASPIHDIEISNMEISHWSGAGLDVGDNAAIEARGRLSNANVGAVLVKNNYFHHNRHYDGDGYGVNVEGGAYALIEQNVFDENRHAIAGGSRPRDNFDYSGYTARDNLILPGGGVDCNWTCWQTHQIDMHGDGNEWYSDNNWLCGTAGETILIERNTILYTAGPAIEIRGNPADKAVVDRNVFKHGDVGDAITQYGGCGYGDNISNPIDVRSSNVYGVDPSTTLGHCDFFGDGNEDQFMATGVTWWAFSPTTQQWRYLNTMPQRLAELQLRKVDGDNVCDVALPGTGAGIPLERFSKSGTGPWQFVSAKGPALP